MSFKPAYKKITPNPKSNYVNSDTSELLSSEQPNITSYNVIDPNYFIVDSKDHVIVDKDALEYLKSILDPKDMYYVYELTGMCNGEYNIVYDRKSNPHTRATLMAEFNIAKTRFSKLLSTLYNEGVISHFYSKINRQKEVKHIILNPTLARRTKRISATTKQCFRDLAVKPSVIQPSKQF